MSTTRLWSMLLSTLYELGVGVPGRVQEPGGGELGACPGLR